MKLLDSIFLVFIAFIFSFFNDAIPSLMLVLFLVRPCVLFLKNFNLNSLKNVVFTVVLFSEMSLHIDGSVSA